MFDVVLKTNDEIVEYAKKLQEKGARNVLVSMAGDGAILITEEGEVHVTPCPKGEVKKLCRSWRFHGSRIYHRIFKK